MLVPGAHGGHITGAAFTTTNTNVDGIGHCQNGNENINCNIYNGKDFVWLNGGPGPAQPGNGTYFFAVLVPGGQGGGENPNDGTPNNLSDLSPTSGTGAGDAWTCRVFTISAGAISYAPGAGDCPASPGGPHDFDSNKIRLMPYDDTTNNGGVYILAICNLAERDANATNQPGVDPSACKYDAFKVNPGQTVPSSQNPSVDKTVSGSYTTTYDWAVSKVITSDNPVHTSSTSASLTYVVHVTHDAGTVGSISVSGTITATNPNSASISGVDVTDALSDTTSCDVTGGSNATLAPGDNTFAYSCSILGSTVPTDLTNTVTITWPDQLLDDGTHLAPSSASATEPTVGSIDFSGTNSHGCTTVDDPIPSGGSSPDNPYPFPATVCVGDQGDGGAGTDPLDGFTFTYHVTYPVTAGTCTKFDNTATISGDATSSDNSSQAEATVCGGLDLQVSKDANPAFKRTFHWGITKDVDKTLVEQIGGTATFNYTVKVTHDSGTDSAWVVKGTITVTNPNDWEAITYDLADAVGGNGTCSIDGGGTGLTVAASSTAQATYTCTYLSAPNPASDTNTATASWDKSTYATPDGSASGTAGFNFGSVSPTLKDNCVTVTDPNAPTNPLGSACNTDASPKAFTYSKTVNVPANNCVKYSNTATFTTNTTGTTGTASQTVEVCGPARTGALTMGFWQNKNGQGIISGQAKTGVCPSATWLRQYAPFQDLSPTATCSQVATYVYNVVKAATCGGSTCNPMLKAQMLATALDVYFSNSALGGNKINAPAPIGGVTIDLTKICTMIDGSGGIGTCSGSFKDASTLPGYSASMTVLQILTAAAAQFNAGTGSWFGQNKALQVCAKDVFDAINNQVAFSP